jgi:hypothetical protein
VFLIYVELFLNDANGTVHGIERNARITVANLAITFAANKSFVNIQAKIVGVDAAIHGFRMNARTGIGGQFKNDPAVHGFG